MKFSWPLVCVLILSCVCFGGSYEELSVFQSPLNITVNEGEPIQISCCWNKANIFKVFWYKHNERIPEEKGLYQMPSNKNCSFLEITNTVKNDTGDYVCKVIQDIPILMEYEGQKTHLNFVKGEHSTEATTQNIVHTVSSPTTKKPAVVDHPKRNTEDANFTYLEPKGSSQEVVIIYIFRSLPFICLLVAFFYLNRDNKQVTSLRPAVEHAVELGVRPDEDLEAGETQKNETEEVKHGENISEQEKGRVNNEKPEVTVATEEEKPTAVVVSIEQGASPMHDNENKTISVTNTEEKTHLMPDVEEGTVSVLADLVSAL
ncbi:uncharacterized protein LOC113038993 [Carassius auratus]|uniref:Uncharacterized protein LOC113038993 n=1 Tax=Carassius auratus TaxID=7957 RepID=A0A6P6J288_CARAU|nr:uncharacterized protein LOC113038993 [Carassius auratus]